MNTTLKINMEPENMLVFKRKLFFPPFSGSMLIFVFFFMQKTWPIFPLQGRQMNPNSREVQVASFASSAKACGLLPPDTIDEG